MEEGGFVIVIITILFKFTIRNNVEVKKLPVRLNTILLVCSIFLSQDENCRIVALVVFKGSLVGKVDF